MNDGFESIVWLFSSGFHNRNLIRLNLDEAALLWKYASAAKFGIIEVGMMHGGTTCLLAAANDRVCILSIGEETGIRPACVSFLSKRSNVTFTPSAAAGVDIYDFAFFDGKPTYQGIQHDYRSIIESLAPYSLLAFHDAVENAHGSCPGVVAFCQDLLSCGVARPVTSVGSMLILQLLPQIHEIELQSSCKSIENVDEIRQEPRSSPALTVQEKGVLIVGNGTSVLDQELGGIIDSYEHVIRFNSFKTAGFERHVGEKTTIWFNVVNIRNQNHPLLRLPYKGVYLHSWQWDPEKCQLWQNLAHRFKCPVKKVGRKCVAELQEFAEDHTYFAYSTGLLAIWILLRSHESVVIHGFDWWHRQAHHYSDNGKRGSLHQPMKEFCVVEKLRRLGKVAFLQDVVASSQASMAKLPIPRKI